MPQNESLQNQSAPSQLAGKRIAFLVANSGVEEVELTDPWKALSAAGADTVLIAPAKESVQTVHHDVEPADTFEPDLAVADARAEEFDGLVLPGGVGNPDKLRLEATAVGFVKAFADAGKPVAAICHGPWTLVEADVVRGKNLTSWPSLQTDIRNAGGTWHDEPSVTCTENGWTLVTSRKPDDLEPFIKATIAAFEG